MSPTLSLPLDTLITLIFYIVLMAYIIFSLVFYYHWNAYALSKTVTTQTYTVYLALTTPLIALMGIIVLIL